MPELHSFHIFFRQRCIHRYLYSDAAVTAVRECTTLLPVREKSATSPSAKEPSDSTEANSAEDEYMAEKNSHYEKLLIGFLSGLTSFCKTIHVTNDLKRPERLSVAYFNVCATANFAIHYMETITGTGLVIVVHWHSGYKLICITSPDVPSLELTMNAIYTDLITNMVLSNPLYHIGSMISCPEFDDIVAKTLLANIC